MPNGGLMGENYTHQMKQAQQIPPQQHWTGEARSYLHCAIGVLTTESEKLPPPMRKYLNEVEQRLHDILKALETGEVNHG